MSTSDYGRTAEIKAFDETKAGVKGLVDAGITRVPRFFHNSFTNNPNPDVVIPVVDLQGDRQRVVDEVKRVAEVFEFFQAVNHGISQKVFDEMLEGVRRFNEEDPEVRMSYYTRDRSKKVLFNSNFDLYLAPVANWRDTIFCVMAPDDAVPSLGELQIATLKSKKRTPSNK